MEITQNNGLPTNLPIIVEDDAFLYPFMITPIFINDDENKKAIEFATENKTLIMITSSKPDFYGTRNFDGIYDTGVVGSVMRKISLSDGRIKILFQGSFKGKILERKSENPLIGLVDVIHETSSTGPRMDALLNVLRENIRTLSTLTHFLTAEFLKTIDETTIPARICDLVCNALRLKKDTAYEFFVETDLDKKLFSLINYINSEIQTYRLENEIKSKVHSKIDQNNKEYFLKEQLKQIQKELGGASDKESEIEEKRKKLEEKKEFLNDEAYKEIKKQIDKLTRLHPDSADANTVLSYLEWALEVPVENSANKKLSIQKVQAQLDKDHHSLEKPKERIKEYFALKELLELRGINKKTDNGAILCFYGPPGVGKTSLANSIATALGRELVRIALGGLEDVSELRGHRRTYVGAMPGRIVQGLIGAKQINPVIVLDEIDKISTSYKGDPTAVLLEVLDPEQNSNFRDHFLNFSIDLSKVIFIATANDVSNIPAPLRDRMEFISLNSYTPQEKFEIAKNYLIPQELKKHGLKPSEVSINSSALHLMIEEYTRESGVRNLRRQIANIFRKIAVKLLSDPQTLKYTITTKNLTEFLDKKVFEIDEIDKKDSIGVVNGLAWTSVGGDVLKIEAIKIKGKGTLTITGQLGDVMKESAQIAFSVVKVLIDEKKLKSENLQIYNEFDLHIHVPEGATPKDGPSAGITIATAIASILTEKKVRSNIAMTGEITLTGKVLPIGGLKEKLIAAHKAKIKIALIPRKNYNRDLDEIPNEVKENMQIIAVDTIHDVLKLALI